MGKHFYLKFAADFEYPEPNFEGKEYSARYVLALDCKAMRERDVEQLTNYSEKGTEKETKQETMSLLTNY